jgi:hypothetical protein
VDFRDALTIVTAELTPQPWDYATPDGITLRVIPAGLREDAGYAEVLIRLTRPDATGLYEFGITGPDSRGVAEVGVATSSLPALIGALTEQATWWDANLIAGVLIVVPDANGVVIEVTEDHGADRKETVSTRLPEAQRLPLASALSRAYDVARGWEDA